MKNKANKKPPKLINHKDLTGSVTALLQREKSLNPKGTFYRPGHTFNCVELAHVTGDSDQLMEGREEMESPE